MKSLQHIFQWKLRYEEAKAISLFLLSWLVSCFCRKEKNLWLFAERGTDARDNGYWMFRYMMENHPEVNAKYVIGQESGDRKKLAQWENKLVTYGSFGHYLLIWQAEYLVSTHIGGYLPYYVRQILILRNRICGRNHSQRIVLLQHGITKDNLVQVHYGKVFLDLFVCGAKPEYDYVLNTFGYPKGVVQYTGLARFDALHQHDVKGRQILLMPTWRWWLLNKTNFLNSEYLRTYIRLLTDVRLHQLLKSNDCSLVFYPHHEVQPFIDVFQKLQLPDEICIADSRSYDVQKLLKESVLLITDYSSVFFDFAYMRKPTLYFQFDEQEFRSRHYKEGYYDYHNGLGEWCGDIDSLLEILHNYIVGNFVMPKKIKEKVESFFPLYDTCNCERIYEAIIRQKTHEI